MTDVQNFLDDLLKSDSSKSKITDQIGNDLFFMAQDQNHETNLVLKNHFDKQKRLLKSLENN